MMHLLLQHFMRRVVIHPPMGLRACILLAAVLVYGTTGFLQSRL